jgi:hypothetical protein
LAVRLLSQQCRPRPSTVVVTPAIGREFVTSFAPESWFFFNDENNTIPRPPAVRRGPGIPPAGTDSVQISVTGLERNLATYRFAGTPRRHH